LAMQQYNGDRLSKLADHFNLEDTADFYQYMARRRMPGLVK